MAITAKTGDVRPGPGTSKPASSKMHSGPGCRINTHKPSIDSTIAEKLSEFASPDISDQLNRLYAPDPDIRCLTSPTHRLCGPICTVKVYPGDNLLIHKILDIATPGDVVVVDAGLANRTAVLGDLVSTKAKHRGIAGFIVDGFIRDLPGIQPLDFPVFARGTTPVGPLHRGPGEINYPICCGGVVVNPSDIAVADQAGVVIVPRRFAAELLARLTAQRDRSRSYLQAIQRGTFSNAWVDELLIESGCEITSSDSHPTEN